MSTTHEPNDIHALFKQDVNMTASELEKWLKTEESHAAGQHKDGAESIGHQSGEHIVRILHKKKADLTADDEHQMHRVHSYISRHLAQRPHGDVTNTTWRHSLMNWGHDPLKK